MQSHGLFAKMSEEEKMDEKIKHVLQEHFNTNKPIKIKIVEGTRVY